MSSDGMESAQMIANTEFHTINSCNVCTVMPEEMSGHEANETLSYVFCASLHFI